MISLPVFLALGYGSTVLTHAALLPRADTCSVSSQAGICISTSSCSGTSTPGFCPGPTDIQCCTYGSCTASGVNGLCVPTSSCSGTNTPGLCPGDSSIQCCTSGGSEGDCGAPDINSASVDLIKEFEGFEREPYTDPTGNPTVGIGHLCDDDACSDVPYSFPLSDEDAASLLQSDLEVARDCLTEQINVSLNDNQYGALVSWAFNEGCGASGSSTLVRRLNDGEDPITVAEEELPKWNMGGGEVLDGLTRRRAAEVDLFQTDSDTTALPPSC